MTQLYHKNEQTFAFVAIAVYCVLQSLAYPLNQRIGVDYAANALLMVVTSIVLWLFLRKNRLMDDYKLHRPTLPARRFLFYVPLAILVSGNLWRGVVIQYSPLVMACYIVAMIGAAFLEELLFRGLLFNALAKQNVRTAIIVSSVTFGAGHILNLLNGRGMTLGENLCQIVFATAVGFLLVTLYHRGGSLIPCILTHAGVNVTSTFANGAGETMEGKIARLLVLIALTVGYTVFLAKTLPKGAETGETGEAKETIGASPL